MIQSLFRISNKKQKNSLYSQIFVISTEVERECVMFVPDCFVSLTFPIVILD